MTKKFLAIVMTFALALTLVGGIASAEGEPTVAELLAQIAELKSLITQLQGGTATVPTGSVPAVCAGISFNRNLSLGVSGTDVLCLQALLNTDAATQVAATGAGSVGQETQYFGGLTRAAVIKFQEKYSSEVLAPFGITAGTGLVGVQTRAKLNKMLEAGVVTPGETEGEISTETPAEGDLSVKWLPTPNGVTADWGAENLAIGAFELKAKHSSITVDRVDLKLATAINAPWRSINYLALYDGSSAIKGTVINSDTLTKEDGDYRLRLSGLGIVVPKDGTKNITIKVNVLETPRDKTDVVTMSFSGDYAIRGRDTAKIDQYTAVAGTRTLEFETNPIGGKIEAKLNSNNPAEGIALTDEDDNTKHEALRFDLKATKDDVEIEELTFGVTWEEEDEIVAARLYDGDEVLGVASIGATTVEFEDLSIKIGKGSTKTLSVEVEAAKTSDAEGRAISLKLNALEAISANGEEIDSFSGSAVGNTLHFFEAAPEIKLISAKVNTPDDNSWGRALIDFEVKALGDDIYINKTTGLVGSSQIGSASAEATGLIVTNSVSLPEDGPYYKITEGKTVTFKTSMLVEVDSADTVETVKFYLSKFIWGKDKVDTVEWTPVTGYGVEKLSTSEMFKASNSQAT